MTGKDLVNSAYSILGLLNSQGKPSVDTEDFEKRAPALINLLLAENSELDCRIRRTEHRVCRLDDINGVIDMSDIVMESVLPYGLARLFMLGEDDMLANELGKAYYEARKQALTFGKAKIAPITEVYQ